MSSGVVAGPLGDLLNDTWFGVAILSTVAVECAMEFISMFPMQLAGVLALRIYRSVHPIWGWHQAGSRRRSTGIRETAGQLQAKPERSFGVVTSDRKRPIRCIARNGAPE